MGQQSIPGLIDAHFLSKQTVGVSIKALITGKAKN
jgi:hypothetical protein